MQGKWKEKRTEIYLTAVVIPSIILGVFVLWLLIKQYNVVNNFKSGYALAPEEIGLIGSFSQISVIAFSLIIFVLFLVLIVGRRDIQKQLAISRLKSDFVSTVSHELKTPLTSIRLLAERLIKLTSEDTEKQKEYHNLILAQSYRLSCLISNILDFSKLEEGKERYNFEKSDLAQVIKQSIEDYPVKLIRPDCKLEINLTDNLHLLFLDKAAISRAFINLLDNALKFSPSDGVININTGKDGETIFIEVQDQGPGIEEKEKHKIFERFYHTGKGTGLGLKIVRQIVEGHGGRIDLVSHIGKGSSFKVILPVKFKG